MKYENSAWRLKNATVQGYTAKKIIWRIKFTYDDVHLVISFSGEGMENAFRNGDNTRINILALISRKSCMFMVYVLCRCVSVV